MFEETKDTSFNYCFVVFFSLKNKSRRKMIHGILTAAFNGKNPFESDMDLANESATDTNDTDEVILCPFFCRNTLKCYGLKID